MLVLSIASFVSADVIVLFFPGTSGFFITPPNTIMALLLYGFGFLLFLSGVFSARSLKLTLISIILLCVPFVRLLYHHSCENDYVAQFPSKATLRDLEDSLSGLTNVKWASVVGGTTIGDNTLRVLIVCNDASIHDKVWINGMITETMRRIRTSDPKMAQYHSIAISFDEESGYDKPSSAFCKAVIGGVNADIDGIIDRLETGDRYHSTGKEITAPGEKFFKASNDGN